MPPRPTPQEMKPQKTPGLDYLAFGEFVTMDTRLARVGLSQDRLGWCENFQIVGPNNLVSVPGPGAPVSGSNTTTFFRLQQVVIRNALYVIAFGTDGSGWELNPTTGAAVQFASPATFQDPDMTTYNADRILIADPLAGYCTWDTVVFAKQGSVSPNVTITNGGSGYTSAPGVTITGGSGAGVMAVASILNGQVVSVQLTQSGSGYQVGDVLTVNFSGGGGTAAAATAVVWPFLGFTTNSIAVAFGRVWISGAGVTTTVLNARILQWSGAVAGGYDNFNSVNAAGSTLIVDADLVEGITALRYMNNFLYIFGDNSVKQIGTISVSGSQTLFTITTISSDQGTTFRDAIVSYNRLACFTNTFGVFAIFGASVTKISDPMDGIFGTALFVPLKPQAAVVDLLGRHTLMILLQYFDTLLLTQRTILIAMDAKNSWYVVNQGAVVAIAQTQSKGPYTLWGTYGSDLTALLSDPNNPVQVRVSTALTDIDQPWIQKRAIRAGISQSSKTLQTSLTWVQESENSATPLMFNIIKPIVWINNSGGIITFTDTGGGALQFTSGGYKFVPLQVQNSGLYMGGTLTGAVLSMTINSFVVEYEAGTPMRSVNTA